MKAEVPIFLTAEWRWLAMLNYEVAPALLAPFVPAGTELDEWNGKIFVSVVGFRFLHTRIRGIPIPFHQNFEEVNLRFYVRRRAEDGWRRGVVFLKELVPRAAIAFIARKVYNENYVAVPMWHRIDRHGESVKSAAYGWKVNGADGGMEVVTQGEAIPLVPDSQAEFITEHYWGYARQRDGATMEYRVEHPFWKVWAAHSARLNGDMEALYGAGFGECLQGAPSSAFLAAGSAVSVFSGVRIF